MDGWGSSRRFRILAAMAVAWGAGTVSGGAVTRYVAPSGGHQNPYTNWNMAATSIVTAASAALDGDTILVTNGTYRSYAQAGVSKAVTVRSVNGPTVTTVDGEYRHRGFYFATNFVLDGFTVTRGGNGSNETMGAGVYAAQAGLITNCFITDCLSTNHGGGFYFGGVGTALNCRVTGNVAANPGGGLSAGGGGFYMPNGGLITHCTVLSNTAAFGGGGYVYNATILNCLFAYNAATGSAGGGLYAWIGCEVDACTITSNRAADSYGGLGAVVGRVQNCILYDNTASSWSNYCNANIYTNCCLSPRQNWQVTCVDGPPGFIDPASGDFRLRRDSPCVNAGTNQPWMTGAVDIDGRRRLSDGIVDIGAYEQVVRYVAKTGSQTLPYDTWATAATNVIAGVAAASNEEVVVVSNGVYREAATISLARPVTLRGFNGSAYTALDGAGARRVVLVDSNAWVEGFTISNGVTASYGAGALSTNAGGWIRDCVITCNAVTGSMGRGGGACIVSNGTLQRCVVARNRAPLDGIASGVSMQFGGSLLECVIENNTNAYAVVVEGFGSGAVIRNTLVARNDAKGVIVSGTRANIEHCTVVDNLSGIEMSTTQAVRNCISYFNATNQWINGTWDHGLTYPAVGASCVTDAPIFRAATGGDYRLTDLSPGVDAGTNLAWTTNATATDLRGWSRKWGCNVDIGAYETPVVYVAPNKSNVAPYDSWANAASNLNLALAVASNGWYVLVTNGTYAVSPGGYSVTNSVMLHSVNGAEATILNGGGVQRCMSVSGPAVIEGFTITGGFLSSGTGAGLYGDNGATIRLCRVTGNTANQYGGGVFFGGGGGTLENSVLWGNAAVSNQGGAVYCRLGNTIRNCLIYSNTASEAGGLLCYQGGLIENCTIVGNASATQSGGGVRFYQGTGVVRNCIVYDNSAASPANIGFYSADGTVEYSCATPSRAGVGNITNSPLFVAAGDYHLDYRSPCLEAGTNLSWMDDAVDLDGSARRMGARADMGVYERPFMYASKSGSHIAPYASWATAATNLQDAVDASLSNGVILVSNGVYTAGSELAIGKTVVLRTVGGSAGTTLNGGGTHRCVNVSQGALLDGFTFTNGWGTLGGGLFLQNGTVRNSTFTRNTASLYGGGAFVSQSGIIEDCRFERNTALTNDGGGVYLSAGGLLSTCIIRSNVARKAGGMFLDSGGEARNCLITHNTARGGTENARGGGVLMYHPGGVMDACTVAANVSSNQGGGVYCDQGGTVRNTIVFGNTAADGTNVYDVDGTWDHDCTAPAMGTACVGTDPLFKDAANGDFGLAARSPCIQAATNQLWMTGEQDVLGQTRIRGRLADVGALESTHSYVATNGASIPPYGCWADAATNIFDALNATSDSWAVVVGPGTYYPTGMIALTRDVDLIGYYGAGATVLDGNHARRVLWVGTNIFVEGLTVRNGIADYGGGIYVQAGTVRDCSVESCQATMDGGGICVLTGIVEHCQVIGNTASEWGGGVILQLGGRILSCLIESNRCTDSINGTGGGLGTYPCDSLLRNCLIWGNTAPGVGGVYASSLCRMENCTVVSNLGVGSDGLGGVYADGDVTMVNNIVWSNFGYEMRVNNWRAAVTAVWSNNCTVPALGVACLTNDPRFAGGLAGYRLATNSPCRDAGRALAWMSTGSDLDGLPRVSGSAPDLGAYELTATHYVSPSGGNAWPYDTPATAARSIADAVAAARPPDRVLLEPGVHSVTSAVVITQAVTVAGNGGKDVVTVNGGGTTRLFELRGPATLSGLTISNGFNTVLGGGLYAVDGAHARIEDCRITHCRTPTVSPSSGEGGGAFLAYNSADLDRCVIAHCRSYYGGGLFMGGGCGIYSSVVYSNTANNGAGIFLHNGPTVMNCTVAFNNAIEFGGGLYCYLSNAVVRGTIAYYNTSFYPQDNNYVPYGAEQEVAYNCTTPGWGSDVVTDAPGFVNAAAFDFRLTTNSPCVDAGGPLGVVMQDIDRVVRPLDGNRDGTAAVDIGAYELMNALADSNTNGMPDGWEQQYYGSPLSSANPTADDDGDGASNGDEGVADTNPRATNSVLRVIHLIDEQDFWSVQFMSSTARVYTIESSMDAVMTNWCVNGAANKKGSGGLTSMKGTNSTSFCRFRVRVGLP